MLQGLLIASLTLVAAGATNEIRFVVTRANSNCADRE
jgi:hypothetical protein